MSKARNFANAEWLQKWEQLGQRISQFPEWMQSILLEDLDTAIQHRIAIFEIIQRKVAGA